jgi:hypothetical protein
MIKFRYIVDTKYYPTFAPVCATCDAPITDVHTANLETVDGDLFIYHATSECEHPDSRGPWCRWSEVLFWLLPHDWRKLVWKAYKGQRDMRYTVFG